MVQRWRGLDAVPSDWGRCVVTIGVFDGVHRGHRQIIGRAVARAGEAGLPSVVLTFDPHPSEVVRPGSHPAVLSGPRLMAELLEALDVDVLCVLPFTLETSQQSAEAFGHEVLVGALHVSAVVVGENFRFGHRAAGNVALLTRLGRQFGFTVEAVPLVTDGEVTYSSTYVRSCVDAGDVAAAARALGRPHRLDGVVVRGDGRGHLLGYPTANVEPGPHAAVPADGVYAARLVVGDAELPAAVSVGSNPTFSGRERRVEAYVLDAEALDLYGRHVSVAFVQRLRGMERFDGPAALVAQMDLDVVRAREVLAAAPPG